MAKRKAGARGTFAGLIRGDLPIARRLGDPRMRRIIPQLKDEGWPIFELAGKRCALAADLDAMVHEVLARIGEPGQKSVTALKAPNSTGAPVASQFRNTNASRPTRNNSVAPRGHRPSPA
jgi:hypothetical protein